MPAQVHLLVLLLLLALSGLRGLLLAVAWLTAIRTTSSDRREVACFLVSMMLTPRRRRSGSKRELP